MLDVFFDPAYGRLYEKVEGGRCEVFKYDVDLGSVSNMYLLRPVPWLIDGVQYYDATTPYGYGGPIVIEGTSSPELIDCYYRAWQEHCLQNRIITDFVRFHLFDNVDLRDRFPGEVIHVSDNVIRRMDVDIDDMWMQFEHKVRKNVKKAQLSNLEVTIDHSDEHLEAFLNIYYATMGRDHAKDYYFFERAYFQQIIDSLSGHFIFFHVWHEHKMVSTELVLYSDENAYSFLGGTLLDYYSMRPNDLLKYEIIKWCKETDKKAFILGGGYSGKDGIYSYKRSFAPDSDCPFYVGRNIFRKDIYDKLVDIRKKSGPVNEEYFPLYRES